MTLLVAEYLAGEARRHPMDSAETPGSLGAVPEQDIADFLCAAKQRFGRYWRKSAREPGTESELTAIAIERLEKLQLIARSAGSVRPRPGLARFSLGEADIRQFGEVPARRRGLLARITMNDRPSAFVQSSEKPVLPMPTRERCSRCGWAGGAVPLR